MSNLSVLDIQNALRESAEQGHDLLAHENMVGLHGRMYPATFKGLDMGGSQEDSWTSMSAIPHENASVQHIHLNNRTVSESPYPMVVANNMPVMALRGGNYGPNRVGEYYIGTAHYATSKGPGGPDFHFISPSGNLSSRFLDSEGNPIRNIHQLIAHRGKQKTTGVIHDEDEGIVRLMRPDEYTIHKQLSAPGKGLVSAPLDRARVAPRGLIHVNHWVGPRHKEENLAEKYLYNPITETLKGIG
jgi:hypothetical protein